MRTMLLAVLAIAVVCLFAATAEAQCQRCGTDVSGCLTCMNTFYSRAILCTLIDNGHTCLLQGECTGVLGPGDCGSVFEYDCPENKDQWTSLRQRPAWLSDEWKVASVIVEKSQRRPRRS